MKKHIKWWKSLSEMSKWNMTINHIAHWVDLTDEQIVELYIKETTVFNKPQK